MLPSATTISRQLVSFYSRFLPGHALIPLPDPGRILNRFSTDFQIIDTSLTDQVRICLTHAFSFVVNVGVIVLVSPRFIPPAILIIAIYVKLSLSYVKCSRDLRRLESNARSPIFSKFGPCSATLPWLIR
jgi:ABC-type multidrug transport system fused ATPase/permease subunit